VTKRLVCDWPSCTETTDQPFTDGWAACGTDGDIRFLPDDCWLCPQHGESFEDLVCNPWKLSDGRPGRHETSN
jgi:hypothetical protein